MAFTGYGASLSGGRWNSKGKPVIYAASSLSLALLEIIVNATSDEPPPDFVYASIDIPPDASVRKQPESSLPPQWYEHPAPRELKKIGDLWIAAAETVALLVPSAVARIESNVLLNPKHPDFARLVIGEPHDLHADPRLPISTTARRVRSKPGGRSR